MEEIGDGTVRIHDKLYEMPVGFYIGEDPGGNRKFFDQLDTPCDLAEERGGLVLIEETGNKVYLFPADV